MIYAFEIFGIYDYLPLPCTTRLQRACSEDPWVRGKLPDILCICPLLCGSTAGVAGCLASFPLDTVRKRMQLEKISLTSAGFVLLRLCLTVCSFVVVCLFFCLSVGHYYLCAPATQANEDDRSDNVGTNGVNIPEGRLAGVFQGGAPGGHALGWQRCHRVFHIREPPGLASWREHAQCPTAHSKGEVLAGRFLVCRSVRGSVRRCKHGLLKPGKSKIKSRGGTVTPGPS